MGRVSKVGMQRRKGRPEETSISGHILEEFSISVQEFRSQEWGAMGVC